MLYHACFLLHAKDHKDHSRMDRKATCPQATCDPAQDGQWTPGNEVYCKAIFTLLQHPV